MSGRRVIMTLSVLVVTMVWGCSGKVPSNLGVKQGKFAVCPSSPNCVSSQASTSDEKHYIKPLIYRDDVTRARNRLNDILSTLARNRIVAETDLYLHVEFSSALMGFVDDVEFFFGHQQEVEVRSASRLGYSDFGVNRKRIEHIRQLFEQ